MGSSHHLDVTVVVDESLAVFAVFVSSVKYLEMFISHMWRTLDGLATAYVVVGFGDLRSGVTQRTQEVEIPGCVLVDGEAETLQGVLTKGEDIEGVLQLEDARQGRLKLDHVLRVKAFLQQALGVDVRSTFNRTGANDELDNVVDLMEVVAETQQRWSN